MTFVTRLPLNFNYVSFYEETAVKIYVTRGGWTFLARFIIRRFSYEEKEAFSVYHPSPFEGICDIIFGRYLIFLDYVCVISIVPYVLATFSRRYHKLGLYKAILKRTELA